MSNLFTIIFYLSLFAVAVFIVIAIVRFVKKDNSTGKKQLMFSGISFALAIVSFIGFNVTSNSNETKKEDAIEVTTTEEPILAEVKTDKPAAEKEVVDEEVKKDDGKTYLNEEATLNDVTYTVDSVETSNTVAGYTSQSGTYLIVTLTVRNDSNESVSLSNGDFKVLIDGAEYEDDPTTTAYHDGGFLLEDLNPKMSKTASVVYEVPSNASETPKTLQIQPNMFKDDKLVIQLEKRL